VFDGLIDAINPHTPNFQAAWELEQWLGSAASQKIMGQGGYIWPAIPSLDPLFAAYWAGKGVSMSGFLSESKGNLLDWPNTPGMNQGLTDMQRDMGPIWLGPGSLAQTSANISTAASDTDHDLQAAQGYLGTGPFGLFNLVRPACGGQPRRRPGGLLSGEGSVRIDGPIEYIGPSGEVAYVGNSGHKAEEVPGVLRVP
jgi:hypothetical protein